MNEVEKFFDGVDFKKVRTRPPPELIFLCGGGLGNNTFFRPHIYDELKLQKCKIIHAEDVMKWQVSRAFKKDILELEKYIAALVSIIPIVCESEGSIAELGVFISDEIIRKKLYIIIEDRFYSGPDSESFIRMGPIENYEKNNKRKAFSFNKKNQTKKVNAVCTAVLKCKIKTSKFNFSNKYFHILLLIDIINMLLFPTIQQIKKALNYALKQAKPKPVIGKKEIEEMLAVLIALELITETTEGEGKSYFRPAREEFYLDYWYVAHKKYKNIYEVREESIDEIYS